MASTATAICPLCFINSDESTPFVSYPRYTMQGLQEHFESYHNWPGELEEVSYDEETQTGTLYFNHQEEDID